MHGSFCAAFILPPSRSHPAPSAPPHVPQRACRPLGSLLCHMHALGNWEGTALQGWFLPKHVPLQGTPQVVSFQGARQEAESSPPSCRRGSRRTIHFSLVSSNLSRLPAPSQEGTSSFLQPPSCMAYCTIHARPSEICLLGIHNHFSNKACLF